MTMRLVFAAALLACAAAASAADSHPLALAGTWTMAAAYELHPDGSRTTNYGEHPHGLLMVDKEGRYSLQIFRPDRAKFASGDKTRGSGDEYRQAVIGSSTHVGHVRVDATAHRLVFDIETASFPNWDGTQQL